MSPLQAFIQRLRSLGLSERQIDEAVDALNDYNNARLDERGGK